MLKKCELDLLRNSSQLILIKENSNSFRELYSINIFVLGKLKMLLNCLQ